MFHGSERDKHTKLNTPLIGQRGGLWARTYPLKHTNTQTTGISISNSSMQSKWLIYNTEHTLKQAYNYYHCGTTHLPLRGLNPIYAYLRSCCRIRIITLVQLLFSQFHLHSCSLPLSSSSFYPFLDLCFFSSCLVPSPPHLQGYRVVIKWIGGQRVITSFSERNDQHFVLMTPQPKCKETFPLLLSPLFVLLYPPALH